MGSEMCIRDRYTKEHLFGFEGRRESKKKSTGAKAEERKRACILAIILAFVSTKLLLIHYLLFFVSSLSLSLSFSICDQQTRVKRFTRFFFLFFSQIG